jgi:hypothetical protein
MAAGLEEIREEIDEKPQAATTLKRRRLFISQILQIICG